MFCLVYPKCYRFFESKRIGMQLFIWIVMAISKKVLQRFGSRKWLYFTCLCCLIFIKFFKVSFLELLQATTFIAGGHLELIWRINILIKISLYFFQKIIYDLGFFVWIIFQVRDHLQISLLVLSEFKRIN